MNEELIDNLYELLGGTKVGTRESFVKELKGNESLRMDSYKLLGGESIGTYDSFMKELGISSSPQKAKVQPQKPVSDVMDYTKPPENNQSNIPTVKQESPKLPNPDNWTEQQNILIQNPAKNEPVQNEFDKPSSPFNQKISKAREVQNIHQTKYDEARKNRIKLEDKLSNYTNLEPSATVSIREDLRKAKAEEEKARKLIDISPDALYLNERIDKRRSQIKEGINNELDQEIYKKQLEGNLLEIISPSEGYNALRKKEQLEDDLINEFSKELSVLSPRDKMIALHGVDYVVEREKGIEHLKELHNKNINKNIAIVERTPTSNVNDRLKKAINNDKIWEGIQEWGDYQASLAFGDRDIEYEKLIKPYINQINDPNTKLGKIYAGGIYDEDIQEEVKAKTKAAISEIYEKQYQTNLIYTDLSVNRKILDKSENNFKESINNEQQWQGLSKWSEYIDNVNKGEQRDFEYEQLMSPIIQELQNPTSQMRLKYDEYINANNQYLKSKKEFDEIDGRYKLAEITEKYAKTAENMHDKMYEMQGSFGKYIYNAYSIITDGVDRNVINNSVNLYNILGERLGSDKATERVYQNALLDEISLTPLSTKFDRPNTEKKATFTKGKNIYTIGFKSDGTISGYYDANDEFKVDFISDPLSETQKSELYKNAKWDRNWKTHFAQGGKVAMDVMYTMGYIKGAGLVAKGARSSEFLGGFVQYYDDVFMDDIRQGMPIDDAYAHSILSNSVSNLIEIANPMLGRIAKKGRGFLPGEAKSKLKNMAIAIKGGKVSTSKAIFTAAKGGLIDLVSETGEEIIDNHIQVPLNNYANQYLNGDFDQIDYPNILDDLDTGITTMVGTIASASFGAAGTYNYMKSNGYINELRYKAFNPKNKTSIIKVVDKLINDKKITHEEGVATKTVAVALEPIYKEFENIKSDDPRTEIAKNNIIGLQTDIEYLKQKKTGAESDAKIDELIKQKEEKVQGYRDVLYKVEEDPNSVPEDIYDNEEISPENADAYDFDGTLIDNSGNLTELGKSVKERIDNGEKIDIITARTENDIQQIKDVFGESGNLQIHATGNENAKRQVLDELGISPYEYYDADSEKLNNIRSEVPFNEINNIDKQTGALEVAPTVSRETKSPQDIIRNSTISELRGLPESIEGERGKRAYEEYDKINWNDQQSIIDGVSRISEIINAKWVSNDRLVEYLNTKRKIIGSDNVWSEDYIGRWIAVTTKDFTNKDKRTEESQKQSSEYDAKKADIERRRQEKLNNLSPDNLSVMASDYLFTGGIGSIIGSDYFIQSLMGSFINASSKIALIRNKYSNEVNSKYGNLSEFVNTDLYNSMMEEIREAIKSSYNTSEAENIFNEILKSPTGVNPKIGNQLSIKLDEINNTVDQINAKYDAELAALEGAKPAETTPISDKKADIERRRQEELKQVKSLEQTPEQLIRNTKIAEQRLRDAEEIFSFGNTYSDALDNIMLKQKKLNEILRKREKEETKNRDFHQWEKEELEKQPEYQENKRLDKIIALINEVYTEGKSENFNNSTKEAVDYEQNELNNVSSKKYRNTEEIRKINAKYDAEYVDAVQKGEMTKEQAMQALEQAGRKGSDAYTELAALEGAKPAETTPISDKKADIERRRQEELLGETFTKTTEKIVTSKGPSNGKTVIRKVKSKISSDGEVLTITPTAEFKEGGGVTTTPETMTLKEFKEQFYEKMSEEDKDFFDEIFEGIEDTERIKLKEARIGLKGVYKGHVNIDVETLEGRPFGFRINNDKEINAKYDAELAELEKQQPPQGKGEGDWSAEQQRIENDKTLSAEQKEKAKIEITAKALEVVDESKLPEIIDEESYLAKNGAPFMGGAEPALHKNIQEGRAKQQMIKRVSDEMNRNNQKREELRKEYAQKIKEGKILSPSRNDKLIATANSNPDLESTQAARRLLEKKGIDWGIGKSKLQSISEAYHKAKADGSNPELVKAVEDLLSDKSNPKVTEIESKKADIERRRQEELKQVKSLEQTPEQLIRNTKIAEQRLRDAEEIFSFGNTYSDALDNIMLKQKKLNEILRKREKEETKNRDFHQWEKEELEKQPEYQENKRLDKIIALINEVYTEGKSENFNNSTKEAVDYEQNELNNVSSKKYRNTEEIRKINAKYDAEYVDAVKKGEMTKEQAMQALEQAGRKGSDAYTELAALEGAKPAETTPISDKKADIERRRQEEILNRKGKTISQSEVQRKFLEKRNSDKTQKKLTEGLNHTNGNVNSEKRWIDKDDTIFEELIALGVKPDSRGIIDNLAISKTISENESKLKKEVNEEIKQEGLKRVTDEFRKQDDLQKFKEINAKYDAELEQLDNQFKNQKNAKQITQQGEKVRRISQETGQDGKPIVGDMQKLNREETQQKEITKAKKAAILQDLSQKGEVAFFDVMDMQEIPVTMNDGSSATIKIDEGGKVEIHSGDKIQEIGNIEDVYDQNIGNYGVNIEESPKIKGNYTYKIGDETLVNRYSDPLDAINLDENGNVESVDLETVTVTGSYNTNEKAQKKYTPKQVTGEQANQIAVSIYLEKLEKNNQNEKFEQWAEKEMEQEQQNDAEIQKPAGKQTTGNVTEVQSRTGQQQRENGKEQGEINKPKLGISEEKRKVAETKEKEGNKEIIKEDNKKLELPNNISTNKLYSQYLNRLINPLNNAPEEIKEYVKNKINDAGNIIVKLSDKSMKYIANKLIDNVVSKQDIINTLNLISESASDSIKLKETRYGLKANDPNGWEFLALRMLAKRAEVLGENKLASEIELYIGQIANTSGRFIRSLRVMDDVDTNVSITVNQLLASNNKDINQKNEITGKSPLEEIKEFIENVKPDGETLVEFTKKLKESFDKNGNINIPENKKLTATKVKAQKAFTNYKKLLRESRSYLGSGFNPKLFEAGVELMKFAYYSARGSVEDAINRFNKQAKLDNLEINAQEIIDSKEFKEFQNGYDIELQNEKKKQIERLANRILNPETRVTRAESKLASALKKAKQKANPKISTRTIYDDILKNEISIKELLDAKSIINDETQIDAADKQIVLNEIDKIIETITNKSIGKNQLRKAIALGAEDINTTIAKLATDRIKSDEVKKSLLEDIIETTGLNKNEAQKYVEIYNRVFDEILSKEVEKRINAELNKLYKNDVEQAKKVVNEIKTELEDTLNKGDKTPEDLVKITKLTKDLELKSKLLKEAEKKQAKKEEQETKLIKNKLKQTPTVNRLMDLVKSGVLSDNELAKELSDWFGLNPLTELQKIELKNLMLDYETKNYQIDKNRAMKKLLNFIDEVSKPASKSEKALSILQEYAYLNMLNSANPFFSAIGGNFVTFMAKHFVPDTFRTVKEIIFNDPKALPVFLEGITDGFRGLASSGNSLLEVMWTGESSDLIFDSDAKRVASKKYLSKYVTKAFQKGVKLLKSNNNLDKVRGLGYVIPFGSLGLMYITYRSLIAADVGSKSFIIPYLRNRNAYYEILKTGYDKNSVNLLEKVNELVGKNSLLTKAVEESAIESGLTGRDLEHFKNKRFNELIEEFAAKNINESAIANAEEMAMQGNVYGGIGMFVNPMIEFKARAALSHSILMKAGSLGLTWVFPFMRPAGIGFNILKSATLFNLVQTQRNEEGKLTSFLPQRRTEARIWQGVGKLKETRDLTSYEKLTNKSFATIPLASAIAIFFMIFKGGEDDDGDYVLNLRDSNYRITGGDISYGKGKTLNGYGSYSFQKKIGDTWVTLYNYENNPAGIALAPLGTLSDKIITDPNSEGVKINELLPLMWAGISEFVADYGWAASFNMIQDLYLGLFGEKEKTKENYRLDRAKKKIVKQEVPGGAMGTYIENIAVKEGWKTKKQTNGETFLGINVEPIIDPFTGSIYYSWIFENESFDAYGQKYTPDMHNKAILDAIGTGAVFGTNKDNRPEYVKTLQKYEKANLIHIYYPPKANSRTIEGKLNWIVDDLPLKNQREITRQTSLNVKMLSEENIDILNACNDYIEMRAIQSTIQDQSQSQAWSENFLENVKNDPLFTMKESKYITHPKSFGFKKANEKNYIYDSGKIIDWLAENNLRYIDGKLKKVK